MIGQIITYNGAQYGLLAAQPNWETEVNVSLDLPTSIEKEPITFYESRRTFAQTARYSMQWRAYMASAKDANELRIFLTRVRGESLLVPMWPDMCQTYTDPDNPVGGGGIPLDVGATVIPLIDVPARFGTLWIIANADFSIWEIVTAISLDPALKRLTIMPGTKYTWPPFTTLYPLMVGRLTDRPKPESISDETFEVDLRVKENSDFSARLSTLSGKQRLVGSHIPAFTLTPLFDSVPNHSRPLDWTEQPDVLYEMIGFLRQEQQRVFDHRNARGLELEFYQNNRTSISDIERFWRTQRGPVLRFMVPTWHGDMRMSADTGTSDVNPITWIPVEDTEFCNPGREPEPGDPFIAIIDANNAIDPYQLSTTYGIAGHMHLVATTNVAAHTAANSILSNLLLARFADATVQWTYTTPYIATTRLKIVELPHEYGAPPDPLPEPAYLFIFTEQSDTDPPVIIQTDRYTSYENTIIIPDAPWAGTYTPAPYSFATLKTGLKLDQEKLDFKSHPFDGNPLTKLFPFALDGILTLDIVEVVATLPRSVTAKQRFHGDVASVSSDYEATAVAFGNLFDRLSPRFLLSVSDNYTQFTPPTMLSALAFQIIGTLLSTNGQIIIVSSGGGWAKEDDYFAGGWLEVGAGELLEKRGILHSEPGAPGQVVLHVDRPLIKNLIGGGIEAPTGNGGPDFPQNLPPEPPQKPDTLNVYLYPGYDGSIDQCDSRFDNRINFGGHAYIPNVNPGVKAMKPKPAPGGKK